MLFASKLLTVFDEKLRCQDVQILMICERPKPIASMHGPHEVFTHIFVVLLHKIDTVSALIEAERIVLDSLGPWIIASHRVTRVSL